MATSATIAVRALGDEMRTKLKGNAREWIAADLSVRLHEPPSDDEIAALAPVLKQGVDETTVTEFYGMARSSQAADSTLVYLKVVDPTRYPFYGLVDLRPPQALSMALRGNSVAISKDLLNRLELAPGGWLRLGGSEFRVSSIVTAEPDWYVGLSTALPFVLLSTETFNRSSIARLAANSSYRLLFRLTGANLAPIREQVERIFPYAEVSDYRDPDPPAAASLEEAAGFIALAAGILLAAAAIALALMIYLRAERNLDAAAVMKVLGARSKQILLIYAAQASMLALSGGVVGAVCGPLFLRALAGLAQLYLPLGLNGQWEWFRAPQSVALGLFAALPAVLGPMLLIQRVRPMSVLRRHVRAVDRSPRVLSTPNFLSLPLRFAMRNIFRPGHHSMAIVLALTGGVAMLSATYVTQRRIGESIAGTVPANGANLYLVGLDRNSLDDAVRWAGAQPGVEDRPKVFPLTWLRLTAVNGAAVASDSRGLHGLWLATCSQLAPAGSVLLPRQGLGPEILPGDVLEFTAKGRTLRGRASGRQMNYLDDIVSGVTFPCAAFDGLPTFYHAALRVSPAKELVVRQALGQRFPSLPVLSRAEFSGFVRKIADQALRMVRSLCWMVLAIGLVFQALLVGSAQRVRAAENAIARALGARPSFLTRVSCFEFGVLGLLAGLAGGLLGAMFASVMLSVIFHRFTVVFDPLSVLFAVMFTALMSAASGSLVAARTQLGTPLQVLRDE